MNVCICEKSCDSSDMNIGVVNTGYLKDIANDENHEDKKLAQEWLDAIYNVHEFFEKENHCYGANYRNPSDYSPSDAQINYFPAEIAFCCEIYCG